MADQHDQQDARADLGPKPEPDIEPGEPNPGGPDAIPDDDTTLVADLSLDDNPAVRTSEAPEELQEGEDTSTQATRDDDAGEAEPAQQESPA